MPFQRAQRYLERVCPQIIERIIKQRMPVILDQSSKHLEEQGAQIMVGRTEEVRQRVNDWMDKAMRQHTSVARGQISQGLLDVEAAKRELRDYVAVLMDLQAKKIRADIEQWMPMWWTRRVWMWVRGAVGGGKRG
jgi:hypothetical protein